MTDVKSPLLTEKRFSHEEKGKALLVGTYRGDESLAKAQEELSELKSLADTLGLITVGDIAAPLRRIDPATFLGKGKVEEIRQKAHELKADWVIFDDEISPQQQKNLEKGIGVGVIDRTELILSVFAERATSKEARIQIELAMMRYLMPRLKRMWTHLSRQRSGGAGGGFVKGEGETQIEIDRRLIRRRIDRLTDELAEVRKARMTQRHARKRQRIPTFAIIGYTNVGKSTLMNALTDAEVLVEDKLFATLDTTTRRFLLPNRQEILLIDTVGFIRKIPHTLIEAFKSTLEEATDADILIHLIDVSSPQAIEQAEATYEVLKELKALDRPLLTVLNKVDAQVDRLKIDRLRFKYPRTIEISAKTGQGFDKLLDAMVREIQALRRKVTLRIPQEQYGLVSEVMKQGSILSCTYEENDVLLEAEIPHLLEKRVELYITSS